MDVQNNAAPEVQLEDSKKEKIIAEIIDVLSKNICTVSEAKHLLYLAMKKVEENSIVVSRVD